MARFPVFGSIGAAIDDLLTNKIFAAKTYGVVLAANVVISIPSLLLVRPIIPGAMPDRALIVPAILLGLISAVVNIGTMTWMFVRWSGLVVERVTGAPPPPRRFWATIRAFLKLFVVMVLAYLSLVIAVMFLALLGRILPVMKSVGGVLMLCALLAVIWVGIRLILVPARAGIGEGTSIEACWRATKGCFWRLFGLGILNEFVLLASFAVVGILFAIVASIAFRVGWITGPGSGAHMRAWLDWYSRATQQRGMRMLLLLVSILSAPVIASAYFIVIGAYARVAIALRLKLAVVVAGDPWQG